MLPRRQADMGPRFSALREASRAQTSTLCQAPCALRTQVLAPQCLIPCTLRTQVSLCPFCGPCCRPRLRRRKCARSGTPCRCGRPAWVSTAPAGVVSQLPRPSPAMRSRHDSPFSPQPQTAIFLAGEAERAASYDFAVTMSPPAILAHTMIISSCMLLADEAERAASYDCDVAMPLSLNVHHPEVMYSALVLSLQRRRSGRPATTLLSPCRRARRTTCGTRPSTRPSRSSGGASYWLWIAAGQLTSLRRALPQRGA